MRSSLFEAKECTTALVVRVQGVKAMSQVSEKIKAFIAYVNVIDFIEKTTLEELRAGG